jgi:ferritin-like metal-binding protein YciE
VAKEQMTVIQRYIQDAIAAEKSFETQLLGFSETGDDLEVRVLFATHAEETRNQYSRLTRRLEELGAAPSAGKSFLAHLFSLAPKGAQITHIQEEKTVQNLMMAYTVETAECAMYEALAAVAGEAGDEVTAQLARDIQAEETATAQKIWHFLPTRSLIAYNMLTVSEVDPSVETRAVSNRLI